MNSLIKHPRAATIQLQWEKVTIPFRVDVDVIRTQLASFRSQLRGGGSSGILATLERGRQLLSCQQYKLEGGLVMGGFCDEQNLWRYQEF